MSRLPLIEKDNAPEFIRGIFDTVTATYGSLPNIFRVTANSPAMLQALVDFDACAKQSVLTPEIRAMLAVTVSEINGCDYCISAHAALGKGIGLSALQLEQARSARSDDRRTNAMLHFAAEVAMQRGHVGEQALARLRALGISDRETVEIIGLVVLNTFTNYINNVADTDIDFPVVHARHAGAGSG